MCFAIVPIITCLCAISGFNLHLIATVAVSKCGYGCLHRQRDMQETAVHRAESAAKEVKCVQMTGEWSEEVSEWVQNKRFRRIIS